MAMRWAVVLLVILGVAAAASATFLALSLRAVPVAAKPAEASPPPQPRFLVAARDLPAMTIATADCLRQEAAVGGQLPEDSLTEPAEAIGKILMVPLKSGQAITRGMFPLDGSGPQLATLLPDGMRAVTVSLSDHSALEGLLYPGSRVDVVSSFPITRETTSGEAVSTTLLENIEVLAVEQATIVDEPDEKKDTEPESRGYKSGILVTLRVDTKQAEAIELATVHGTISLAMRNPQDQGPGAGEGTVLSGGRLARLAELLKGQVQDTAPKPEEPKPPEPPPAPAPVPPRKAAPVPQFNVDVIRGVETETLSFPRQARHS